MECPPAPSQGPSPGRNLQGNEIGQATEKVLEAHDHQGHVRRRGIHPQSPQDGAIHPPRCPPHEKGQCNAPGTENHLPTAHHLGEEEPARPNVQPARCPHQGHNH